MARDARRGGRYLMPRPRWLQAVQAYLGGNLTRGRHIGMERI